MERITSLAERIITIAEKRADSTAVVSGSRSLTFAELASGAFEAARHLEILLNGKSGSPVGLCTDNLLELTVGALGAWLAGSPYLPIDPKAPAERIAFMMKQAGASVIGLKEEAQMPLDEGWQSFKPGEFLNLSTSGAAAPALTSRFNAARLSRLAYIIYTSGSTGQPKGVAVTHENLANLSSWYADNFQITEKDRATQIMALTFDVSVNEIWPNLAQGAAVYAPDRSIFLEPERLRNYLVEQEITICEAPALVAEQLMSLEWPRHSRLRYLMTGGESLRLSPPADLPFRIANSYGPTEATVISTSKLLEAGHVGTPSIGRPITGAGIYLLDADLHPVEDGQTGEIFIEGAGVADGYIGRPDLTRERFIENPFRPDGGRLYRTGDQARKLPNGEYQFCGRLDDQIKLRGHRIEPGEIVAALTSHPAISSAAVTALGHAEEKRLVAYVILQGQATGDDLRRHLSSRLPAYMIPETMVRLDRWPATRNGKIDFAALPAPDRANSLDVEDADSAATPETPIQKRLAAIISSVLSGREIGMRDNFFWSGGNSLLAARLVTKTNRAFGISLSLREIFEYPTVKGLSSVIEDHILRMVAP